MHIFTTAGLTLNPEYGRTAPSGRTAAYSRRTAGHVRKKNNNNNCSIKRKGLQYTSVGLQNTPERLRHTTEELQHTAGLQHTGRMTVAHVRIAVRSRRTAAQGGLNDRGVALGKELVAGICIM